MAPFDLQRFVEAQAYWQHPILGARLKECVELVLAVKGKTAFQVFGTPDDLKLRSSMTLFSDAVPAEPLFKRALIKYFDGRDDPQTTELLLSRVVWPGVGPFAAHCPGNAPRGACVARLRSLPPSSSQNRMVKA